MKKCTLFLILFLISGYQTKHAAQAKQKELTGVVTSHYLLEQYSEFKTGFDNYQPSAFDITALQNLKGKKLVVLFGTWCHDSIREVPRLLKLIDKSGFRLEDLQLIAVNYDKQEPSNLHAKYNLKYTPTIILLDGEYELGRIIEKPFVSLGQDLAGF